MSIPWQEVTTSAHATSNDTDSVIPPARDMGVDPIPLDTTTLGIADALPIYHADDNGLLEGNPCTSDTNVNMYAHPLLSYQGTERGYPQLPILALQQIAEQDIFCQCCVGS